jgi:hypothetical protein
MCYAHHSLLFMTDVTQSEDDESFAASMVEQSRGDCPRLNNSCFLGAVPPCQPKLQLLKGFYLRNVSY